LALKYWPKTGPRLSMSCTVATVFLTSLTAVEMAASAVNGSITSFSPAIANTRPAAGQTTNSTSRTQILARVLALPEVGVAGRPCTLDLAFCKHIDKHRTVFQRFNLMPLCCRQVYRLRVFGHYKLTAFLADYAATCVAHGQV
jgi:hypothetical protein